MEMKSYELAYRIPTFLPGRILSVSLMGLLLLAGCQRQPAPATAPQSTTAQPTPQPTPPSTMQPATEAKPAPAAATSAPIAAAPMAAMEKSAPVAPKTYTIAAGTPVTIRTSGELSAKNNNVGDSFSGTLVQPLSAQGKVLIRAGAPVSGVVVAAKGQGKFKGDGALGIQLKTIGSRPVSSSSYEKSASGKGKRSAVMIGGGGGAGALIGGLAGGGKGALIGGLVGAGAGTAGAAYTGNKNISIPAESTVTFTLTAPIRITAKPGSTASE